MEELRELSLMDFRDYMDKVLETENPQEQIKWLERALEFDPKRIEDVLRVAKGLVNLPLRSSGRGYIAALEKRARSAEASARRARQIKRKRKKRNTKSP